MKTLPILSAHDIDDLLAFHKSSKSGETTYLDPSNPVHKTVVDVMQAAAGLTVSNYPYIHNTIFAGKVNANAGNNEISDNVRLVDAGKTKSGTATARVLSRSGGLGLITGGSLAVMDADSGKLLAYGSNVTIQNGFLDCCTEPTTSLPVAAGQKLAILYQGQTTDESGAVRLFSYADTALATESGTQCNVSAPYSAINNPIQLAVGRTTANPPPAGTDYIYVEPATEQGNAFLISPFIGNVALSGSVDIANFSAADIYGSIYVVYTNNTPAPVEVIIDSTYTTAAKIQTAFALGTTPNILTWNFPYDSLGYASTNSIVYVNGATLNNQAYSCFYFAFNSIPLVGGGVAPAFYVCSQGTPHEPSVNCTIISNLTYWYHCLAKGTLITLDDGSTLPIEQMNERRRVKTGVLGSSLAVYATVQGKHTSDPASGPASICRLTTANGKSIVATKSHMVFISPDKCRMIEYLTVGESILTDEGLSTIASIEPLAYDDMFYGLALGNAEEQQHNDFPKDNASFYAGGILCADELTMRACSRKDFHDLDYILPRVKAELRHDYSSASAGIHS